MNHMYRAMMSSHQLDISTTALLRMSLQCIKRNYCFSKDLSDSHLSQGQDILLQNMKSATDVSDVLYCVKLHHEIMNNRHLMQAFRTIFVLQKSDNSHMSNGEVINSSGFRVLCDTLKHNVRSLEISELLDALKTLTYLGVSSSSKLVQILLHILTKEINGLSLQQLLFFDFLLKDFVASPTVEALRIALPVVIDSNIKLKADKENVSQLSELLHYATKRNLSRNTLNFLIDHLMKQRNNIDFKSSKSIIRSLCDIKNPQESHRPILHYAIDTVIENIPYCTYQDFESLISKLASRYTPKNYYFYHEHFLKTVSQYIINNSSDFEESVWHLRKLLKFGYVSIDLLEYISQLIGRDNNLLKSCGTLILFTLVGGYAQADYRPANWKMMEPLILENALSHLEQVGLPWVKFTRDLCTLDCWPTDIFYKLFSPEFLEKYLAREFNMLDHLQLLSLQSSVVSLCNWYRGPLLPTPIFKKAVDLSLKAYQDYPLKKYLVNVFGEDTCVFTGAMTKAGHLIDYLVMLKSDGNPVHFPQARDKSSRLVVDDFPPISGCQKIVILHLPANCYTSNTCEFKGPTRMLIDSFESKGLTTICINSFVWEQLLEHEKVPFLQQEIQCKTTNWNSLANKGRK